MRFRTAPWTLGLAVMGGLGVAAFLSGIWLQLFWLRLASKAVPLLCLTVWLWPPRDRYTRWIAAGLTLSLVGDLVLEAREDLFLLALGAFLLAHVAYVAAYLTASRTPRWILGVPILVSGAGIWWFLRPGLGSLALPVGVYVAVICTMIWRATALVGTEGLARREQWAALMGALCFGLSDTLLAFRMFVHPIEGMSYAIILLYWAGQLGIALSAVPSTVPNNERGVAQPSFRQAT
ncbi:lysoplasmalogenase [Archangium minus]|uniref:Lysoplasmalogenase n=1 Tax=Archangium minus TaxID=83450 RepID=A0ABY9X1M9_9BACT|nr:lysoplasmalogenase [Archangium minus]